MNPTIAVNNWAYNLHIQRRFGAECISGIAAHLKETLRFMNCLKRIAINRAPACISICAAAGLGLLPRLSYAQTPLSSRLLIQTPAPVTPPTTTPPGTPPTGTAPTTSPQIAVGPKITGFIVRGNKTLNQTFIIDASGAKIGDIFTSDLQYKMVQNLTRTGLFRAGYTNSTIPVQVQSEEPNPPNGTCTVVITVEENPTVKNITITGSGPIKPDVIMKYLANIKPGTVFNAANFAQDDQNIQALYNQEGYLAAISQDLTITSDGVLEVPLIVARVASLKIVGLHKTHKYVVTREMQTKVGGYFNQKFLRDDQRALLDLGIFKSVIPSAYQMGPGQIGITLTIEERRTGSITGGLGYSATGGIVGYAEALDSNFRGTDEKLSLRASTGGIANRGSVELGFTEPYLDSHHTSLSVQLYDRTEYRFSNSLSNFNSSASTYGGSYYYNEQRAGGTITLGRPYGRHVNASVFLRAENVTTDLLNLPLQDLQIIQDGPIYAVGGALRHDTRDYYLNPASGGYQELALELGHANLKAPINIPGISVPGTYGSATFLKLSLEAREYYSLSGRRPVNDPTKDETILALRAVLGGSTGTLPFAEQFFVGGGDTLRGYRDSRFWGKYEFLSSIELRQPLAPKFTGVLFTDIGDAWGGPYSSVNINRFQQSGFHLHVAVGVGVLVVTPIGALRLDYGVGDEGGRADFSIGQAF